MSYRVGHTDDVRCGFTKPRPRTSRQADSELIIGRRAHPTPLTRMQYTMNKRVTRVLNYCHHNRKLGLKKERKIVQRLIEQIYISITIIQRTHVPTLHQCSHKRKQTWSQYRQISNGPKRPDIKGTQSTKSTGSTLER